MSSMQTSLYLIAVALCIFSTGLTTRRAGRGAPLTFFTVYLVIQSAAFVVRAADLASRDAAQVAVVGLLMSSSLLVAPCLWLAFQESIGGARPRLLAICREVIGWRLPQDSLLTCR